MCRRTIIGTLVPATFKYTDETKESFLNAQYIRGGAGFQNGLNEIQFVPGVHAKTALHFDFAASRHTLMAVETGIGAEYYTPGYSIDGQSGSETLFCESLCLLSIWPPLVGLVISGYDTGAAGDTAPGGPAVG